MGAFYLPGCLTLTSAILASASPTSSTFAIVGTRPESMKARRSWDVVLTQMSCPYINPDYFGPASQLTLEGPQTFTFRVDILRTLPSDVKVTLRAYELICDKSVYQAYERNNRNEYVPSLTYTDTLCGEVQKSKQAPIFKCFHYVDAGIRECPIQKGNYTAKHVKCTSSDCPAMVPGHYWRINNTWLTKNNVLLVNRLFDVTVQRNSNIG